MKYINLYDKINLDYEYSGIMNRGGIMKDKTTSYSIKEFDCAKVKAILTEVSQSLEEKNYNAKSQLVGYLMSGDPGYISSFKDARKKITSVDRSLILKFLLENTLGDIK